MPEPILYVVKSVFSPPKLYISVLVLAKSVWKPNIGLALVFMKAICNEVLPTCYPPPYSD